MKARAARAELESKAKIEGAAKKAKYLKMKAAKVRISARESLEGCCAGSTGYPQSGCSC